MWFVLPALASSLAYSTDVIFGKMALDGMDLYVFIFVLAFCYVILAIIMFAARPRKLIDYFSNPKNKRCIWWAIGAVVIGTMVADIFLWWAIGSTPKPLLALTVAIVHTVPVFSLLLVWLVFKEVMNWKAVAGIFITVLGCIITIYYGNIAEQLA